MTDTQLLVFILLAVLIIAIVVVVATLMLEKTKKKNQRVQKAKKRRNSDDFWFNAYNFLIRFRMIKKYLLKVRKRIEILEQSDNWTVSRQTVKFAFVSLGIPFVMLMFLLMMRIDLYYLIVCIITIVLIHNSILTLLIDRIENRLLEYLDKFIGDVRHHYHEHNMIDEAIYDTIEDCKYEMSIHAARMYEILTSSNIEEEMESYNDRAPNKFFRTFLSNCFIVQKYGDKIVDGQSMFLTNLNFIKQEIQMEVLKRRKLEYVFSSLSVIAILPIFSLKPLENWGISNMPELKEYFSGTYGFVVQIIMFLLVILAYELIRRLKKTYEYQDNEGTFLLRLLQIPFIGNSVRKIMYKKNKQSLQLAELMRKAGSHLPVGTLYLKRILYALMGLSIGCLLFIQTHQITRQNLLNPLESEATQSVRVNKAAQAALKEMDREIIIKFRNQKTDLEDIIKEVEARDIIPDAQLREIAAERIYGKLISYQNQYFKWWELIVSFTMASLFYYVPYWLLLFKKRMVMMNMEEEVMQFHTIILMIMYVERIAVEDILRWMEQFAFVFKESIRKCLNNFESGDDEALEQLKLDEPFVPFIRVVENLQSASDKIPIVKAFDQLRTERGYYQEKRKQDNEILVNKKGIWGRMIAFIPLGAVVMFYIMIPFIQVSLTKFAEYKQQMSIGF